MGRERGGGATRPARHGMHATDNGGSPASWDSTTRPAPRPHLRRPALGSHRPHNHSRNYHDASTAGSKR